MLKKGPAAYGRRPTACMVRRVWLASNNAPAHQMAAIQVQSGERASARALVMTDTLHQGRGEGPGLQRMAVFLQRAV